MHGLDELLLFDLAVPTADFPAANADSRDLYPRLSEWPIFHVVLLSVVS